MSSHGQHFSCPSGTSFRYTMAGLLQLRPPTVTQPVFWNIPKEMKPRKRGKRGGVRRRKKAKKHKPYLPVVIMGNVQSLANKLDELSVCVKYQHKYRMCSVMCYTETWLTDAGRNSHVNIDGFSLFRGDRTKDSCKKKKEKRKKKERLEVDCVCL